MSDDEDYPLSPGGDHWQGRHEFSEEEMEPVYPAAVWGGAAAPPPQPEVRVELESPFKQKGEVVGDPKLLNFSPDWDLQLQDATRGRAREGVVPGWDAAGGGYGMRVRRDLDGVYMQGNWLWGLKEHNSTSMLCFEARLLEAPPRNINSLAFCCETVQGNTERRRNEEGVECRIMSSSVVVGVIPLAVRGAGHFHLQEHPARSSSAAWAACHLELASGLHELEPTPYSLSAADGRVDCYEARHDVRLEHEVDDRANLVGPRRHWGVYNGGFVYTPDNAHSYVEWHFLVHNDQLMPFMRCRPDQQYSISDHLGRTRTVVGHVSWLEARIRDRHGVLQATVPLYNVPVVAPLKGGAAAALAARCHSGGLGMDFAGCQLVDKNMPWVDANGVHRRGVVLHHPPGAPGLVVGLGLLRAERREVPDDSWRRSKDGLAVFHRYVGELALHTGLPLAINMPSAVGVVDLYQVLLNNRKRFSVQMHIPYQEHLSGRTDSTRDFRGRVHPLRWTPQLHAWHMARLEGLANRRAGMLSEWQEQHGAAERPLRAPKERPEWDEEADAMPYLDRQRRLTLEGHISQWTRGGQIPMVMLEGQQLACWESEHRLFESAVPTAVPANPEVVREQLQRTCQMPRPRAETLSRGFGRPEVPGLNLLRGLEHVERVRHGAGADGVDRGRGTSFGAWAGRGELPPELTALLIDTRGTSSEEEDEDNGPQGPDPAQLAARVLGLRRVAQLRVSGYEGLFDRGLAVVAIEDLGPDVAWQLEPAVSAARRLVEDVEATAALEGPSAMSNGVPGSVDT